MSSAGASTTRTGRASAREHVQAHELAGGWDDTRGAYKKMLGRVREDGDTKAAVGHFQPSGGPGPPAPARRSRRELAARRGTAPGGRFRRREEAGRDEVEPVAGGRLRGRPWLGSVPRGGTLGLPGTWGSGRWKRAVGTPPRLPSAWQAASRRPWRVAWRATQDASSRSSFGRDLRLCRIRATVPQVRRRTKTFAKANIRSRRSCADEPLAYQEVEGYREIR